MGDDLRQDALVMQLLRVMSDLWMKEGLDMEMQLYDCISTGRERGLINVVKNSNTLGKYFYACGAEFISKPLYNLCIYIPLQATF